jgi:putative transposase
MQWLVGVLRQGLLLILIRGEQYISEAFLWALSSVSAKQSMSRCSNYWDNAPTEIFFHPFKVEAIYGENIETRTKMEYEVFDYIEHCYNRRRKHSNLGAALSLILSRALG